MTEADQIAREHIALNRFLRAKEVEFIVGKDSTRRWDPENQVEDRGDLSRITFIQ